MQNFIQRIVRQAEIRNGVRYIRGNQNRKQNQAEIGAGSRELESNYTIQDQKREKQTQGKTLGNARQAKQDFAVCESDCAAFVCVNEVQVWQGNWLMNEVQVWQGDCDAVTHGECSLGVVQQYERC